ncbi:hypothetical protein D3C87_1565990 [compost metagenome]
MNKVFLAALVIFNVSTSFAVDWNDFAKSYKIQGETLKVSKINFKDRFFAHEFCGKLDMELADIRTIVEASRDEKNPIAAAKFKADFGNEVFVGVWGWTSEKVKMADDAKVFVQRDGTLKVDIMQFSEVNNFLISNGMMPYKGLPAICRPRSQ